MKIASWNVNSIRAREEHIKRWMEDNEPDILMLQELKADNSDVPAETYEEIGFSQFINGQKQRNGTAVFYKKESDFNLSSESVSLPGITDIKEARFQQLTLQHDSFYKAITLINIYAPNGNPVEENEPFQKKCDWNRALINHLRDLLAEEKPVIIGGDFNVIPQPEDCYDPVHWDGNALFHEKTRAHFREMLFMGLYDAFRVKHPAEESSYTFWDYQGQAWPQNLGIRIDHFLLSGAMVDRLKSAEIDTTPRGWKKPSDHTPIVIGLDLDKDRSETLSK